MHCYYKRSLGMRNKLYSRTRAITGRLPLRASVIATVAIAALAAEALAHDWTEQGPGPILNGANTVLPPNSEVAGAINAIAPDPVDPAVVFVGTVSGGIWMTQNATAADPTWQPLTDNQLPELPITSLAISPVDPQTIFAGTGSTTSFNRFGELGIGVARSTDRGVTWEVLAGPTFTGAIVSIVPLNDGSTVLAATWPDTGGVYQSTDNGDTFTQISGNGTSGLPAGGVSNLIADPSNPDRFYAGVPAGSGAGAAAGVYRSDDDGVTWTQVNSGLSGLSTSLRILLTIHNSTGNNVVYADVIDSSGALSGAFRSTNQGGSWTSLGVPSPSIYPGFQGFFHGAFAADPSNPNVVFISGDRQDLPFPNANGCTSFSGNVFRHTGTAWENVVCSGTADGSSPHPDSRFMAFDASGNLLQSNDGGIARLVNPNNAATRQWVSADGNIGSAEFHSIALDSLSNIFFGGTQDNGTPMQIVPGGTTWNEFFGGDGGVVGVDDDQIAHPGTSLRYTSSQFFGAFNRSTWDASNTFVGSVLVGLNITSGPCLGTLFACDPNIQFYQPFTINAIDPSRMLIGTASLYESLNGGDSLTNLGFLGAFVGSFTGYGQPMAYGSRFTGLPVPAVFYVGAGSTIYHRVSGPITTLGSYPGGGVVTIAMNPNNYQQVYVCDINNQVWGSSDEGVTWVNLTANLPALTGLVTTIAVFSPDDTVANTTLFAGGFGIFALTNPSTDSGTWAPVTDEAGASIPPALALDLHFDYTNGLVAGTLGRGAWILPADAFATASSATASSATASRATASRATASRTTASRATASRATASSALPSASSLVSVAAAKNMPLAWPSVPPSAAPSVPPDVPSAAPRVRRGVVRR
jgi:hypothetical protein